MIDEIAELLSAPTLSPQAERSVGASSVASAVAAGGAFDGASRFDQLALWAPAIQSADGDILPNKDILDARTRDMLRNDAYVAGGQVLHQDNIVGAMYLINARPMTKILWGKQDDVWEEEFQEEVETKFMLWAESGRNWSDAQATKSLTDSTRLAVGTHLAAGEVLASAEWMADDGRPFRTATQMIDTDRLCDPLSRMFENKIRGGVERDKNGAPVAYHIRMGHPSDYANPEAYLWRRVMARKPWGRPNILHIYDQIRPDQSRGISAMVTALQEIKMLKSFRKVELQRAVIAATYAASIESELPPESVLRAMGNTPGEDENPVVRYMAEYLAAVNEYAGSAKNLTIDGVKIPIFMPGTKLNLKNPGAESPAGDKFEQSALRYVAAATGVSYEQLSRDYTQTNYSSARASRGEMEKYMASKKKKVADGYATFVYSLWLEEAINGNQLECLKRKNVPLFYEGLNREAYTACDWLGAGSGLIDPLKEMQAYVLALNNKIGTRERVFAKLYGSDWRRELRQMAREEKAYEKAGVVIPADAQQDMQNALSGSPAERKAGATAALRSTIEEVVAEIMEQAA